MRKIIFLVLLGLSSLFALDKVCVYKNFAQVTSFPTFNFEQGVRTYNWTDIPSSIIPHTIRFVSGEKSVKLLSQSVDKADKNEYFLFEKYNDKLVTVFFKDGTEYKGKIILNNYSDGFYLQDISTNEIYRINKDEVSKIKFPALSSLFLKPNLSLTVYSKNNKQTKSKISYLSGGLNWDSNINLIIDGDKLKFNNWISIINNTDKSFVNAEFSVMEGVTLEIKQEDYTVKRRYPTEIDNMSFSGSSNYVPKTKTYSDSYEFIIPDKVSIKPSQQFQYQMAKVSDVEYSTLYQYSVGDSNVKKKYQINNTKENGLGIEIPASKVFVYEKNGSVENYTGDSNIDYISQNEKIGFIVGNALDLEAYTEQVTVEQNKRYRVVNYKIELTNRKKDHVDINVEYDLKNRYNVAKIISSDENYVIEKNKIKFQIRLLEDSSYVFNFKVKISY